MDLTRLKTLYTSNQDAKAVLDCIGEYKRNVSETTLDTLVSALAAQGLDASRVRNVLRELDRAGIGQWIVGRRGSSSRIFWKIPVSSVLSTARGGEVEPEADTKIPRIAHSPKPTTYEHTYLVRPGFTVKFELPIDLTHSESSRLGDFIKTLHMGYM